MNTSTQIDKRERMRTQRAALQSAIAIMGTQRQLAASLTDMTGRLVRQNTVADWLRRGMPWWWAAPIATLTGIPEALLFPPEQITTQVTTQGAEDEQNRLRKRTTRKNDSVDQSGGARVVRGASAPNRHAAGAVDAVDVDRSDSA